MRDLSCRSPSRPWESPDWANKKSKPLKKMIFSITLTCNSHILKSTIEIEEINKKFHVPPLHCSLRGFPNHFPGIPIILHPYNCLQTYSYIICSLFYPPQLTLILWTYYQRSPWFSCLYYIGLHAFAMNRPVHVLVCSRATCSINATQLVTFDHLPMSFHG